MTEISKDLIRSKLSNITQLRDLLLGEKLEQYDRNFSECREQISKIESELINLKSNLQKFESHIKDRLDILEEKLTTTINNRSSLLSNKIEYLHLETNKKTTELQKNIEDLSQDTSEKIKIISREFESKTKYLSNDIQQTKDSLDRELKILKNDLSKKLDDRLANLATSKLSRSDFAEILFEICLKIKESDNINDSAEEVQLENDNPEVVELLLPENTNAK